jgi:alkaline phosphatase D
MSGFMTRIFSLLIFVALAGQGTAGDAPLARIGFGSCVHQDKPQPIWDAVVAAKPDLFLFIGDNLYHDVIVDKSAKNETLAQKYAKMAAQPGVIKLKQICPLLGTWDDHDYGLDDAGAEYPHKKASQQAFLDFFGVPKDSPRRSQEGIYHAQVFGPPDKSVQVILLDTRYFRSPLKKRAKRAAGDGPYEPNPDPDATMLGEAQWQWLETQLRQPAKVRLLCSSIQVVAEDHHHEKWANLPRERERLFKLIADTKAAGVIALSGDRHLAELSMMDAGVGYPFYDLTSSGLTQATLKWRKQEVNRHRVMTMNFGNNFGLIQIDWDEAPVVRLQIRDVAGDIIVQQKVPLSVLQPGTIKNSRFAKAGDVRLNGQALTAALVKELLKKDVTLEMTVQATGMSAGNGLVFLNSETDRTNPDNFTVVIDKPGQQALQASGIANPREHFQGKKIAVTGTLSLFREQPQIIVSAANQIRLVE